jgi:hypothetical protein
MSAKTEEEAMRMYRKIAMDYIKNNCEIIDGRIEEKNRGNYNKIG